MLLFFATKSFQASFFIKQILLGVQHLHNHNVAHLDLKVVSKDHHQDSSYSQFQPENVMLLGDNSRIIKLIDFGLSRKILPGAEVSRCLLIFHCLSP